MGERTANVHDGDIGRTIKGLAEVIRGRRGASPEESYTARLLAGPEDKLLKKVGDKVTAGTTISLAGEAGSLSTGSHLHLELWHKGEPVDPALYIKF